MDYRVRFDPLAAEELAAIHEYVLERTGSPDVAEGYTGRLLEACLALSHFPERGTRRDDIRPGLRTMGFERRATIAFVVEDRDVTILRILHGGRDTTGLSTA